MSKESIPKHFDMPRTLFAATPVYKLPVPTSQEARQERRLLAKGVVVAREQARGCRIAASVLRATTSTADQSSAVGIVAPALIGSSWHELFRGKLIASSPKERMRKVMYLPRLDTLAEQNAPSSEQLWNESATLIEEVGNTDLPVYLHMLERVGFDSNAYTIKMARKLNASALLLSSMGVARLVERGLVGDDSHIQHQVRSAGHATFAHTQELARKIGCIPTVAQLAHPYSPLSVELMRSGSETVIDAYQNAVTNYSASK